MKIDIQVSGIEMTPALNEYAQKKAESLLKYFEEIVNINVIIGMDTHNHNKGKIFFAEMKVFVPGNSVFVKKEAADQYKAIDKVRDHLKVELEKLKGKMRSIDREALRNQKGYHEEEN